MTSARKHKRCSTCKQTKHVRNTVIGMCDDSVLILNSAIRYVQEWAATHAAPANASPETEE